MPSKIHTAEKISIVTVLLNESRERIDRTFSSIRSQTWPNKEVIVVDGGSRSLRPLEKYKDLFSVFVSESDTGIYQAMNKGVGLATGEWIVFMNVGDSFSQATSLENAMKMAHDSVDILYGDREDLAGRCLPAPRHLKKSNLFINHICHQAMVIRASAFTKVGRYREDWRIGSDAEWNMQAFVDGLTFQYVGCPLAIYAGGGVSVNYRLFKAYRKVIFHKYFSRPERIRVRIISPFIKLVRRIQTRNWRMPIALKERLTSCKGWNAE